MSNSPLFSTACLLSGALLTGCASTDRVVFVTNTELGVGYDGSAGTVNLGYDRNEIVIGPDYPETGAIPPVYARLRSHGNLFKPGVSQLYATGDAASLATSDSSGNCNAPAFKPEDLKGVRRLAVFGTSTNFGLKLQFVNSAPESMNFGYKRKEYSWLPLNEEDPTGESTSGGKNRATHDVYPSVLASVGIGTAVSKDASGTSWQIDQFFATGDAANQLACSEDVRRAFEAVADEAMEQKMSKALENTAAIPSVPNAGGGN